MLGSAFANLVDLVLKLRDERQQANESDHNNRNDQSQPKLQSISNLAPKQPKPLIFPFFEKESIPRTSPQQSFGF